MEWPDEFGEFVRALPGEPSRIVTPGVSQIRSVGRCRLVGLDHVGGYEPLVLVRYAQLINVIDGAPKDRTLVLTSPGSTHPVLDMMGGRFWLLPKESPPPPGWPFIAKLGPLVMYENPEWIPRVLVIPKAVVMESDDERLAHMIGPSFEPRKQAVPPNTADTVAV